MTGFSGLTTGQVDERHRLGQSNRSSHFALLKYAQIVSGNLFTLFNATVVPASFVLLILHDSRGAIADSGMALVCVALYLAVMYCRPAADFFRLTPLSPWQWVRAIGVVAPVYALSRLTDRIRR